MIGLYIFLVFVNAYLILQYGKWTKTECITYRDNLSTNEIEKRVRLHVLLSLCLPFVEIVLFNSFEKTFPLSIIIVFSLILFKIMKPAIDKDIEQWSKYTKNS